MTPASVSAARDLLVELGAPSRLLRHADLVGEAAELLLKGLAALSVPLRRELVLIGVVLHDAGKIRCRAELEQPGSDHEPAGEALLLEHGVSPELARVCLSHARWSTMEVTLEEMVIALADKLWKGVRRADLEERVIDAVSARAAKARWDLFVPLDTLFEEIAAGGPERLRRSTR